MSGTLAYFCYEIPADIDNKDFIILSQAGTDLCQAQVKLEVIVGVGVESGV